MTGPESVVLPLHHSPIVIISVLRLQRYKDFYKSKQKRVFFFKKIAEFAIILELNGYSDCLKIR